MSSLPPPLPPPPPIPKANSDKRTLTRRFDIVVTCKKTKSYADGDPNRPWYRFQLALIPKHLAHLVDRVQLQLDPSYEVHIRTVRDPFVFSEKAWGQYPIQITVFPKDEFNHPPIHVPHLDLVLTKSRYTEARVLAFRNLPDHIKKKYFATGTPSAESSSQGQPPSSNSSSSDLSTTASASLESTSPRQLSPPPVSAGSTRSLPKNGRKALAGTGSGGSSGRERKVSSSSAAAVSRAPVSANSRAPMSQSGGRANAAKPAPSANRPPAPPKRKAADPSLSLAAVTPASDSTRPVKRLKSTVTSGAGSQSAASGSGGGVAAMLGLAAHPPTATKRKPAAPPASTSTASVVSAILPTHKIPDDRIPRITNPHSAAHALVRSPPPTSFNLPLRPLPPSSPPPMTLPAAATPADAPPAGTSRRLAGGGITVRRVDTHAGPGAITSSVSGPRVLRSPPPAPAAAAAPTPNVQARSGSTHATPSRAAVNPALQLPAKPTFAPPLPPASSASSSSSAAGTPLVGNNHKRASHLGVHSTPTRPGTAAMIQTSGGLVGAASSPPRPRPDPDQRDKLKDVLARISPAASVELAKYLYVRNYATRATDASAGEAEGKAVYDKVGNALVLDVWRVPAEVVREMWVFVREKGLVAG